MQSGILPFRPVLRDFIRNLWVLRFFFFLIAVLLLISASSLAFAEGTHLVPGGTFISAWSRAIGITMNNFLFGFGQGYVPVTVLGKAAQILNSFISKLLLGVLLWVVQQSLSDHTLKKSKYMLFPTEEDL
jgi:hypothetical protein